jgi:hypothetical protein
MKVDLNRLRGVSNPRAMDAIISDIIKEANNSGDQIYISDLLIASAAGEGVAEPLLERLREDKIRKYKLFCIRDKNGNQIKPGDKVKRWYKKSLMRDGVPIPGRELNTIRRTGRWESDMNTFDEFQVDEKGCIAVDAVDAEYFLTHFGIHGESEQRISFHPDVKSAPYAERGTGKIRVTWYWRFKELSKDAYMSAAKVDGGGGGKNQK